MTESFLNTILVGECREQLANVPAGSFHCVITSPPYFGLRSYLPKGHADKAKEIGSEQTPEEFIGVMVDVFRAVRRVLRDDGVLWVNLGDSYNAAGRVGHGTRLGHKQSTNVGAVLATNNQRPDIDGMQDGSQMLMPHRVAMALQADGWVLRSTIVWAKRSPMPESISGYRWVRCRVKVASQVPIESNQRGTNHRDPSINSKPSFNEDFQHAKFAHCPGCPKCSPHGGYVLRRGKWRPTTAHEYVFMFSKGGNYFCDGDAVAEAVTGNSHPQNRRAGQAKLAAVGEGVKNNGDFGMRLTDSVETRNPRSVWTLSNEPYKGSHFATFPTKLVKPMIEAATSAAGCCAECGAPWAPVVEKERVATRPGENTKTAGRNSRMYRSHDPAHENEEYDAARLEQDRLEIGNRDPQRHVAVTRTTGHRATCSCNAATVPCRVLDPFGGSGTTAQVARVLGRDWTICELNPEYVPLAEKRIQTVPKWALPKAERKLRAIPVMLDQKPLFDFQPQ